MTQQAPEPGPVEWDERELRPAPMPAWARGCCAIYFVVVIAALVAGGYALARWLS